MARQRRLRRIAARLGLASCALLPVAAAAGSYSVVPVRIQFGPRDRAVAVTVANLGDTPMALTAELFRWDQNADGSDQLTPTDDLLLAPGLVRLAAKGQQVVRLVLLRRGDTQVQATYRMIVREQPDPASAGTGVRVPVAVAMSLPVFVTPPAARWDVVCAAQPQVTPVEIRCTNRGTATALVRSARIDARGESLARFDGGAYLLPGASRPLVLSPAVAAHRLPGALTVVFEDEQSAVYALP